jgi:hypothetical protein
MLSLRPFASFFSGTTQRILKKLVSLLEIWSKHCEFNFDLYRSGLIAVLHQIVNEYYNFTRKTDKN